MWFCLKKRSHCHWSQTQIRKVVIIVPPTASLYVVFISCKKKHEDVSIQWKLKLHKWNKGNLTKEPTNWFKNTWKNQQQNANAASTFIEWRDSSDVKDQEKWLTGTLIPLPSWNDEILLHQKDSRYQAAPFHLPPSGSVPSAHWLWHCLTDDHLSPPHHHQVVRVLVPPRPLMGQILLHKKKEKKILPPAEQPTNGGLPSIIFVAQPHPPTSYFMLVDYVKPVLGTCIMCFLCHRVFCPWGMLHKLQVVDGSRFCRVQVWPVDSSETTMRLRAHRTRNAAANANAWNSSVM